jgi:molybdate transport system substrate-binding protein
MSTLSRLARVTCAPALAALAGAMVACASSRDGGGEGAARGAASGAASAGGVSVLFAGSLETYMERDLGPAFARASGYGFAGYGGGSSELAAEIRGGVRRGDVFVSAAAAADKTLEGPRGGSWVSWYSAFAGTPLMLAYNPHSSYGAQLAQGRPWYQVLTEPGVLVGRTDPRLDPKGVLTAEAVHSAARRLHKPALAKALARFPVYPETALLGRLQSGQLDAGFLYAVEAASGHLRIVSLSPVYKYAEYTVTILNRAHDRRAAAALVRFLLAHARAYTLRLNGLDPQQPRIAGSVAAVPAALRGVVGAR